MVINVFWNQVHIIGYLLSIRIVFSFVNIPPFFYQHLLRNSEKGFLCINNKAFILLQKVTNIP
jgi:hypothetical protein